MNDVGITVGGDSVTGLNVRTVGAPHLVRQIRWLGVYVGVIGATQVVLYALMAWQPDVGEMSFVLDPRLGLAAFAERFGMVPWIARWASALLLLRAARSLITRPGVRSLCAYAALETVLAAPSLLFLVLLLRTGLSASPVFSVGELLRPLPVFVVASVAPLLWGVALSWRAIVGRA